MTTTKTKAIETQPKPDLVRRYRQIGIAAVLAAAMMSGQS